MKNKIFSLPIILLAVLTSSVSYYWGALVQKSKIVTVRLEAVKNNQPVASQPQTNQPVKTPVVEAQPKVAPVQATTVVPTKNNLPAISNASPKTAPVNVVPKKTISTQGTKAATPAPVKVPVPAVAPTPVKTPDPVVTPAPYQAPAPTPTTKTS